MGKILKTLIVGREALSNRWWHRLANVLIYGSTLVVAVIAVIIFFAGGSWKKYSYSAYSFESNYSTSEGEEMDCNFYAYDYGVNPSIFCGDISDSTDFLVRYTKARGTYEKFSQTETEAKLTDNQLVSGLIKNKMLKDIRVKRVTTILYDKLIRNLFTVIVFIVGWFIFWESIVYRAFVYIVFGNKK